MTYNLFPLALSTANEHLTEEIRDRINSEKLRMKLKKELNRMNHCTNAYHAMKNEKGTIRVYSGPGQGATFVICLPAACTDSGPDQFDLILTDFHMPGLTGLDLSEKIQGIQRDIPIVLCAGYSKNITRQKLKPTGVRAVLMKPVTQCAFSKTLRDILDHG